MDNLFVRAHQEPPSVDISVEFRPNRPFDAVELLPGLQLCVLLLKAASR